MYAIRSYYVYLNGEKEIKQIVQDAFYISEHKKISEVLSAMQRTKTHMAIVLDQYGGTAGLVTLEDIIEELVGEIYDENDEEENDFEVIGESSYEISGGLSISDLQEYLELDEDIIETECT